MAHGGDHNEDVAHENRHVYDMLPDLNAGQQAQKPDNNWYSGVTWMERARDEYLDMVTPGEKPSGKEIKYDQKYLWTMTEDDATTTTAPMTDDEYSDDEEEENWRYMEEIARGLEAPTLWSGER
eukprot:scaffold37455_cov102-Cyclotella_meneghiniana.AAC.1